GERHARSRPRGRSRGRRGRERRGDRPRRVHRGLRDAAAAGRPTQQQSGQELDQGQLKQQTAELLANHVLRTQADEGAGIEAPNEDIDGVLKDVATRSGLSSVDEVIKAFDEQGVPEDEVREDAANQFEIEQYVTNETDIQPPSDDELKAQYDQLVEQSKAQGEQSGQEAEIPPFEDVKQQLSDQAVAQEQN